MQISPKWKRVINITIFWLIISLMQLIYDYMVLKSMHATVPDWYPNEFIWRTISILIAGLIGGSAIVFLVYKWIAKYPFGRVLFYILFWFTILYLFLDFVITVIIYFFFGKSFGEPTFWEVLTREGRALGQIRGYIFWAGMSLITILGLFINDRFGPGIFSKFLRGKYFRARKEERIFMFLDIRSSTSIAERIGEEAYFNFIKQFIDDCTDPILNSKGEIYQYIGDEIVVSWEMEKGLKNANCIQCFYDIIKAIEKQSQYYQKRFDVIPQFKAGIHCGEVMVGEIGKVKRDIAYSGDVLNTTARIQGECNKNEVDLLISNSLLNLLKIDSRYTIQNFGTILLRGKSEKVELHSPVPL